MTPCSLTLTVWQRHTDQTGAGRLPFGLFRYAYMFHRVITIIIMSMSWWQKVCVFVYHIGVSYTLRRNAHAGRHHFLLSLSAVCTNHLLSLRVDSARARAGPPHNEWWWAPERACHSAHTFVCNVFKHAIIRRTRTRPAYRSRSVRILAADEHRDTARWSADSERVAWNIIIITLARQIHLIMRRYG